VLSLLFAVYGTASYFWSIVSFLYRNDNGNVSLTMLVDHVYAKAWQNCYWLRAKKCANMLIAFKEGIVLYDRVVLP